MKPKKCAAVMVSASGSVLAALLTGSALLRIKHHFIIVVYPEATDIFSVNFQKLWGFWMSQYLSLLHKKIFSFSIFEPEMLMLVVYVCLRSVTSKLILRGPAGAKALPRRLLKWKSLAPLLYPLICRILTTLHWLLFLPDCWYNGWYLS